MANPSPSSIRNEALTTIGVSQRVFTWRSHAALWFSLGVGLLVIQMGALLLPALGARGALIAITAGSLLGGGLLAWTARLGCVTGLSSAGLMHQTFGNGFARLPVLLNIAQLIGWTSFELVIMRDSTVAIARQSLGWMLGHPLGLAACTALWAALLMLLLSGSMTQLVRKIISRIGLPLVLASLVWLTWQFWTQRQAHGLGALLERAGDGSMSLPSALDLVVAMPVSWLPLVADYARFGRSGRGALTGTWLGYSVANIWCFGLGVLVASVAPQGTDLVSTLLLAQGGLLALGLILIDEIDNAYGDVYSASVCAHSIQPRGSIRRWGLALALGCAAMALLLPVSGLEPFLLMLSSVFVPLYGVMWGRLGSGHAPLYTSGARIELGAAGIWILGIAAFQALSHWAPDWGATLPSLVLTFGLARATRTRAVTTEAIAASS